MRFFEGGKLGDRLLGAGLLEPVDDCVGAGGEEDGFCLFVGSRINLGSDKESEGVLFWHRGNRLGLWPWRRSCVDLSTACRLF